jgi:hypothetical protein
VNLPASAPESVVQQVWGQVLQQSLRQGPIADFEHRVAIIESPRMADTYVVEGKLLGTRLPDLSVKVVPFWTNQGWRHGI